MDKNTQLTYLWCGPAVTVLFGFGFVFLAGMVPPPGPDLSALEIQAFYQAHPMRTGIAMILMMASMGMLALWGTALALRLRIVEGDFPVLTCAQLVNVAVGVTIVVLIPMIWAAAAFRADTSSPEVIQTINDVGFFLLMAPWPPFSFWICSHSWAVFRDRRAVPEYPKWVGFLGLWVAVVFIPASCVLIFKSGPFAWHGIFGFYLPLSAFFIWEITVTIFAIKAVMKSDSSQTST
jgi:hypothetical protein